MGYVMYFKVNGIGAFPIDMLRYDSCSPAHQSDSTLLQTTFHPKRAGQETVIRLKRIFPTEEAARNWRPTVGRWDSFGWGATRFNMVHPLGLNDPDGDDPMTCATRNCNNQARPAGVYCHQCNPPRRPWGGPEEATILADADLEDRLRRSYRKLVREAGEIEE